MLRHAPWLLVPLFAAACSGAGDDLEDPQDHHVHDEGEDEDEVVGSVSSALTATSPVSAAVTQSCSTNAVKALAVQLVEEIQCLKPGSMKRIDKVPGLALGATVFPYLQTPAANALIAAQKARGVTLSINSGLRALPQQYLLYRWYKTGRCGIPLAAEPGTSNHESGIAVDIRDNAAWRTAMKSKGYAWLGASDPVHFDYRGGGTVRMKGLSVLAFQRLWNRNNPNDKIAEDSSYGPATEARLMKSPVGGFPVGAVCSPSTAPPMDGGAEPMPDAGLEDEEAPVAIPDATEPFDEASTDDADEPTTTTTSSSIRTAPRAGAVEQGCTVSLGASNRSWPASLVLGLAGAGLVLRRRRQR